MRLKEALLAAAIGLAAAVPVEAPAQAKVFRTNIVADPAMIDPITYSELVAGEVMRQMYESFTTIRNDGSVQKALAEGWESPDGGKSFRINLRKGVKFHSGRDFTARDVKYTFEQLLLPGNKGGLNKGYLDNVVGAKDVADGKATELAGITIHDPHTIEVRFTKPEVLFPIYPIFIMDSGIVAQHGADWMMKASAGTGPFRFVHWKRGVEVRADAFPGYWNGAPKIEGIQMLIVPVVDTALAQYEAGELDFVHLTSASAIRKVLGDAKYKDQLIQTPRAQVTYLGMNQNLWAPFKDIRVREAFSLAIDREALIKGVFNGAAHNLAGQVSPGMPGHNPAIAPARYDPARAKKLMADAGFPDGKGLPPLEMQALEPFKSENAYYADQMKRVLGVDVQLKIVERATFIRSMNAGEVPFFAWGWTAGYADALYYLDQMWHSASVYNRPRWKNAEFDRLIEQARTTADDQARFKLYNQAEKVLLDDFGTAPLPTQIHIALKKPNVSNVTMTPFGWSTFQAIEIR